MSMIMRSLAVFWLALFFSVSSSSAEKCVLCWKSIPISCWSCKLMFVSCNNQCFPSNLSRVHPEPSWWPNAPRFPAAKRLRLRLASPLHQSTLQRLWTLLSLIFHTLFPASSWTVFAGAVDHAKWWRRVLSKSTVLRRGDALHLYFLSFAFSSLTWS